MSLTPMPVQLMTAPERAGFRAAIQMIRAEGERMRRAARLIAPAPAAGADPVDGIHQQQKNQLLDLCGKAVDLCCDRVEDGLTGSIGVTLPKLIN